MFYKSNRDVICHIISFLSTKDWSSTQKTAKVFRSSVKEIFKRKRSYFNKCIKNIMILSSTAVSDASDDDAKRVAQIRGTTAMFRALIKHIDLLKLLLSSRYSRSYRKFVTTLDKTYEQNMEYATSCIKDNDDVFIRDTDVYVMWKTLLAWKEIESKKMRRMKTQT